MAYPPASTATDRAPRHLADREEIASENDLEVVMVCDPEEFAVVALRRIEVPPMTAANAMVGVRAKPTAAAMILPIFVEFLPQARACVGILLAHDCAALTQR